MLTILHISDIHFGPPFQPEVAEALLRFIQKSPTDVIVASGDFTQRAKVSQFREARAFLDRLPPVPLVVTPGNHDVPVYRIWERMTDPYRNYRTYISAELDSVLRLDDAVIVAVNSTAPYRAVTNGRIHRWQLDFIARAFEGVPDDVRRIVVAHHHFAPPPDFEGAKPMQGAKRALGMLEAMRVDLILGGHLHRAYIGNSLDVYPGRDRRHGVVIAQSGTTTSRRGRAREREKNSFNVIRIDGEKIRITHHMYFHQPDAFLPISQHVFFRRGKPPLGVSASTEENVFHFVDEARGLTRGG
ncbi:MAG: metallophosphoesterase [Gemmatimonadota bacterium]|jgi:3',5'-cyclic AMP phosphodiesterase CpdA|nr:metallophosphoesterase [Gemmatimonadota bacterium]